MSDLVFPEERYEFNSVRALIAAELADEAPRADRGADRLHASHAGASNLATSNTDCSRCASQDRQRHEVRCTQQFRRWANDKEHRANEKAPSGEVGRRAGKEHRTANDVQQARAKVAQRAGQFIGVRDVRVMIRLRLQVRTDGAATAKIHGELLDRRRGLVRTRVEPAHNFSSKK